jgi:signal transduction histidine kinase
VRRLSGLQAKMTASYVVVTAAAVLLVEAVAIGLLLPSAIRSTDLEARTQATAAVLAGRASAAWARLGSAPEVQDLLSGAVPRPAQPGRAVADDAGGIVVGLTSGGYDPGQAAVPVALLVDRTGRVLASSYPAEFPVGSRPTLPYDPATEVKGGAAKTEAGGITWAVGPVLALTPFGGPSPGPTPSPASSPGQTSPSAVPASKSPEAPGSFQSQALATVYVQVPSSANIAGSRDVAPSLRLGALVLALLLPVGAAFGYLSTRRTVRRIRHLEDSTARIAAGDLDQRVDVTGSDELSGLEVGFNTMAEQLEASLAAERQLSGAAARAAERTRIARELHDSVSQDLFSLGLLSGGLRKALPAGSVLRPEVDAMERTSRRALREMQALLLELRPIAMEDVGLVAALTELCHAYQARLGVEVVLDIDQLSASAAVEHGVLRVVQEALANAVKHGDPRRVALTVRQVDGAVHLRIADDGAGFDPEDDRARGLGLGLASMRERLGELGGQLVVESSLGVGTTVSASVPAGTPS